MKAKTFELEKGEFAVVASYVSYNDATEEEEETTIKTHEKPRPKLYTDAATVALRAREYWKLGDLPVRVSKISFTENDDGRFVRLALETMDTPPLRVMPPRVKRQPETKPGEDEPDPENPKNILLEAVELLENRISEYLNGDREQPELPLPKQEEAAPKQRGLFGKRGKGEK